jgi:hypothetical protein
LRGTARRTAVVTVVATTVIPLRRTARRTAVVTVVAAAVVARGATVVATRGGAAVGA